MRKLPCLSLAACLNLWNMVGGAASAVLGSRLNGVWSMPKAQAYQPPAFSTDFLYRRFYPTYDFEATSAKPVQTSIHDIPNILKSSSALLPPSSQARDRSTVTITRILSIERTVDFEATIRKTLQVEVTERTRVTKTLTFTEVSEETRTRTAVTTVDVTSFRNITQIVTYNQEVDVSLEALENEVKSGGILAQIARPLLTLAMVLISIAVFLV